MSIISLIIASLRARALNVSLIIVTLALSVALLIAAQNIQRMVRASFENSGAAMDMIAAPRGHDMQILLYTVFNVGEPVGTIPIEAVEMLANHPAVDWAVPISLGDSFHGSRVIGTAGGFFEHMRLWRKEGEKDTPILAAGSLFKELRDAVIGADVAHEYGLAIGDPLILQHGIGEIGAHDHDELPFVVSGILTPTATAYDKAVFVPLAAIEAMHVGWESGRRVGKVDHDHSHRDDFEVDDVSAVFIGLRDPIAALHLQRDIQDYQKTALSGILPGATLAKIWTIVGGVETGFRIINMLIIAVALVAMMTMTFASLTQRRREFAILRGVGASPRIVMMMILSETFLIALAACILGAILASLGMLLARFYLGHEYGFSFEGSLFISRNINDFALIIGAALGAALIPAWRLYRYSVQDHISA